MLIQRNCVRNLVQPIVLGTGKNIRKMSVDVGSKVKANQQVLLLTEDFDAVPDMYGWQRKMRTSWRMDWN